jgi:ABC-type multidrug transport system fused ATPase/permease subunit
MTDFSPGVVIGRAWEIYKSQFATLLLFSAVFSLITLLASWLLGPFAGIVTIIVNQFFIGAVVNLVKDLEDGYRDEEISSLLEGVTPVFWTLLVVSILLGIGIAIGLILIIVPGLILLTIWSVAVPVCVIERRGIFACFGRSRELVRGFGWQVFGTIVIAWLITIGIGIVGGIVAAPLGGFGRGVVDWVISALTLPLAAVVASILYFRLRAAKGEPAAADASYG